MKRLAFPLLILILPAIVGCAARAWRRGYIAGQLPDGFVLQERFYPLTDVHISSSTQFRCGKKALTFSDLRSNDLVTVEGGYRKDGSVEARRVTIRRYHSDCESTAGGAPSPSGNNEPGLLVGVLIDTSGHQKNVLEFERGALNLIAQRFHGLGAETFVYSYSSKVQILQNWSSSDNLPKAAAQISLDVGDGQGTRLYDGMKVALLTLAARPGPNLRVLVVIGEGNDGGSSTKYSQVKALAESSQVQTFALLVADHNLRGGRVRQFGWYLDDLASATKGASYDIEHSERNLGKALNDVMRRIEQRSSRTSF